MIFEVRCPKDGTPYYVDESYTGKQVSCTKCCSYDWLCPAAQAQDGAKREV